MAKGIGGVIGCIFAGIMTEFYHPKWCMFWYSFVCLGLFIFSLFLSKNIEEGNASIRTEYSDGSRSTSQENYESQYRSENANMPVP
jgi:hypothetical protein